MFRIKICGVTNSANADVAYANGADAIGLNYYPDSNRYLTPGVAKQQMLQQLPATMLRIGVFVNAAIEPIVQLVTSDRLNGVQLHGDESAEFLAQLRQHLPAGCQLIKAFPLRSAGMQTIYEFLAACRTLQAMPDAVLIDAPTAAGQFGGTGIVADWQLLTSNRALLGDLPLILAGGLTAENVGQAIRQVRPQAVDTASGVESSPGIKDPEMVRRFCQAAIQAYED